MNNEKELEKNSTIRKFRTVQKEGNRSETARDFYSLLEEFNNENFNSVELHRIKTSEVGHKLEKEFQLYRGLINSGKMKY